MNARLNAQDRKKMNARLASLATFHATPGLALGAVQEVLDTFGVAFGMIFQPKTGSTRSIVEREGEELSNTLLCIQTHEMESGSVELATYLS